MENIIVIIGLPGCGKTHYLQKYKNTHIIYDDFIDDWKDISKEIKRNKYNKKMVLSDPRLCIFKMFKKYILDTFYMENVKLILFKNQLYRCISNIENRENNFLYFWIDCVRDISKKYKINKYKKYNHEILDCYLPKMKSKL